MNNNYFYSKLLLLITLIICGLQVKSQIEKCTSAIIHNQQLATNPVYRQKMLDYESALALQKSRRSVAAGTVYQVPTVVHVMHKGETVGSGTNISDKAIQNAIKVMNQMYRKAAGTSWNGSGVDVEIEFTLAVRDPSGNCTNGITRHSMTGDATYMSQGVGSGGPGITDASLKGIGVWTQANYYNIWVVSEINDNGGGSGTQGYAYFASAHGNAVDGMVVLSTNITSGTSTTLAHELGHALNLFHTFEGDGGGVSCPVGNACGTNMGDCCADTPPHKQSSSDCLSGGTNSCDGNSSNALFVYNYMDYSSDACQNMLTADQKIRMVAALTGPRASFLSSNGNIGLVPVAPPSVNFESLSAVVCGAGQTVSFLDKSTCTPNSFLLSSAFAGITHSWTVTNGANTYNSSLQNPVINITNAGTYTVTLNVNNGVGSSTQTKTDMIIVNSSPGAACIPTSFNNGPFVQTISYVGFNTINNFTSAGTNTAYTNLACTYNTIVNANNTYPLTVLANSQGSAEAFEVYIDYNNNNSFSDAGELVFSGTTTTGSVSTTYSTNVTIPNTTVKNNLLRMRVIGNQSNVPASAKTCGAQLTLGDVEDYGVYVKAACTTPTLVAPTNTSVCAGVPVVLNTSGAVTYTWLPSGSGASNTATLTATTVYTIVGEDSGCTSAPVTVTVTVLSTPNVTVNPSVTTICSADQQTITLTASGATNYTWMPSAATTASVDVDPTATTVYTVIGNSGSCNSVPQTATITVVTSPNVVVTPTAATVCGGSTLALSAVGATSYTWLPVPNSTPGGTGSAITVTCVSNVSYSVVGSSNGCRSDTIEIVVTVNPTENITASTTNSLSCSGSPVTFTAVGAVTYTWAPPVATGSVLTVSPGATQIYTVVGTSANGCLSVVKTVTATVGTVPSLTLSATSKTICNGQNTTLSGAGATSYTWNPLGVTGAGVIVTPTTTTTYSLTGYSGSCNSLPSTITVTVVQLPIVAITPINTSICTGQKTILTANGATTYTWLPIGSGTTNTVSPTFTTVYSVIGSQNGCNSLSASATVSVSSAPTITVSPTSTVVCSGGTVTINAVGATTYSWLPTGSGNSYPASPAGTTVFTVTGYNGNCASAKKTATVTVNSIPTVVVNPSNASICKGTSTTLGASGAVSYAWLPTGAGASNIVNPTATTVYTVVGNTTGCNSLPQTVTVTVTQTPTITIAPSNTTICSGQTATVTASGGTSYAWSPSGSGPSVAITPVNSTTTYTVVGSVAGCFANPKTVTIYMLVNPNVSVSTTSATICKGFNATLLASGASVYTWTPGNLSGASIVVTPTTTTTYSVIGTFGASCSSSSTITVTVTSCAGIEDLTSSNDMILYPNPNNGQFTIAFGATINDISASVINNIGQVVKIEQVKNTDKLSINTEGISQGVYYVRVTTHHGQKTLKMIVE